ncbi:DUF86 domain-containing protein [Candidatus Woesearchaeota archaeon]|nr:DUF86 domain-containing protein [Candidatus Woesearchaeota archaeon]
MKRDENLFLGDILENIEDIEVFCKSLTKPELEKNKLRKKAIIRSLEIIGEAVKNLSRKTREENPDVEWRKITGTRDIFIHAYFDIDIDILWRVIKDKLPVLKKQIERIKKDLES